MPQETHSASMIPGKAIVLFIVASYITLAHGRFDLREVLTDALGRLANDLVTSIDETKLIGGVCFTSDDGGPGSACQDMPEGHLLSALLLLPDECVSHFKL